MSVNSNLSPTKNWPAAPLPPKSSEEDVFTVEHKYHKKTIAQESVSYTKVNKDHLSASNQKALKSASFFYSNYVRNLLNQNDLTKDFQSLRKAYNESGLINFRRHKFSYEKNGTSTEKLVLRLGVISDHLNGWTNLKELKELKENTSFLKQKRKMLEKLQKRYEAKGSKHDKQKAALSFALDELRPEQLDSTINTRQAFLTRQFLQLLQEQITCNAGNHPEKFSGGVFIMPHFALLDPKAKKFDKSGWQHDEANEMLDMCEIFKHFQNKTIRFVDNIDAPKIVDDEILMPAVDCGHTSLTLKPVFFNISVQGHVVNDGLQAKINSKGIKNLREALREKGLKAGAMGKKTLEISSALDKLQFLEKRLTRKESGFSLVRNFIILMSDIAAVSTGCLSAKDRTGIVLASVMRRWINGAVDSLFKEKGRLTVWKVKRYFSAKLLSKGQIAPYIAKENGFSFIKVQNIFHRATSPTTAISYTRKQIKGHFTKQALK